MIFEDQDLLVTQHSQISSYILKDNDGNDPTKLLPGQATEVPINFSSLYQLHRAYNITGMVHSKKVHDCNQYQQIVYKFLKLVELELESQSNSQPVIVIPLDFLTLLNIHN